MLNVVKHQQILRFAQNDNYKQNGKEKTFNRK